MLLHEAKRIDAIAHRDHGVSPCHERDSIQLAGLRIVYDYQNGRCVSTAGYHVVILSNCVAMRKLMKRLRPAGGAIFVTFVQDRPCVGAMELFTLADPNSSTPET